MARDLDTLRVEIDRINREMLSLLKERLALCGEVADYKKAHGLPVYVPEREQKILDWASQTAGPEFAPYAKIFFQQLMSLSRDYEHGVPGSSQAGDVMATRPDAVNSKRLILLPLEPADAAPVFSVTGEDKLMKGLHLAPHQSTEETSRFIDILSTAPNRGFKVLKRENAQFAGIAYLMPDPETPEKVLLSVALIEKEWHNGFLTELIPTMETIAREQCKAKSVWVYLPDENRFVRQAFEKAGYSLSSILSLQDAAFQVYTKEL